MDSLKSIAKWHPAALLSFGLIVVAIAGLVVFKAYTLRVRGGSWSIELAPSQGAAPDSILESSR
jgi:hypothetical protein